MSEKELPSAPFSEEQKEALTGILLGKHNIDEQERLVLHHQNKEWLEYLRKVFHNLEWEKIDDNTYRSNATKELMDERKRWYK